VPHPKGKTWVEVVSKPTPEKNTGHKKEEITGNGEMKKFHTYNFSPNNVRVIK
jgi:hypothetical protein